MESRIAGANHYDIDVWTWWGKIRATISELTWLNNDPIVDVKKDFRVYIHILRVWECEFPGTLRANISETVLVLLINEQGEKEKGRDEREFS
jgi:hypothetical protein